MHENRTILVAEDDELIRAIMCEVLADYGFRPAEAANTAEALKLVDERDDMSAAFIDIDLGDRGGGYLVARRVRERRPDMEIVYTSGGAHSDYEHERVDHADFVPKPYRPDTVCNLIARRLG